MKKIISLILVLASAITLCFALTACKDDATNDNGNTVTANTHAEFVAAEVGTPLTIEAYVQAKQGWWENKATIYLQDQDGGYLVYELPISEEDYNKLVDGQKVRISGKKANYKGEHEIQDPEATYEILDGNWKAPATDVTALLGTDELINHQNKFVSFKGLVVVPSYDAEGNEKAWMYNWNGAGDEGNDLYFSVSDGKNTYSFTVESYLCGTETDVYKAVKTLKVGDNIDAEGFLYWYDGVNPHITGVTVTVSADALHTKASGTNSHAEYFAAPVGTPVTIEAFVQAKQGWWENKATIYLQDKDGGYFAYELPISEEDYNKLVYGQKVRISGKAADYRGEKEVAGTDATFEILEGRWFAPATDVTALLGTDELINHQNEFVSFKGLTVVASYDAEGGEQAWMYGWNGAGDEGNDLYFSVSDGTNTYSFTVESYLCGAETEVYKAIKSIKIGDVLDLEGFLYWYDGANPHITGVTVVTAE